MRNFQKIVDELYQEINKARTHPAQLIHLYTKKQQNYSNQYYKLNNKSIRTIEGVNALNSLIHQLSVTHPMTPLQWSYALHVIADEQALRIGSQGIQNRQNSIPLLQRINKYVIVNGRVNEIIQMGGQTGQEILEELLIDDGLQSRKRRRSLLDPRYRFIGIATNMHKKFEYCTVIILADNISELIQPNNQLLELSKSKFVNPIDLNRSVKYSRMITVPQKNHHHLIDQQILNNHQEEHQEQKIEEFQKLQQQNPHMFLTFSQHNNNQNQLLSANELEARRISMLLQDQKVNSPQTQNIQEIQMANSRNDQLPPIQEKPKIVVKDKPDNCILF